MVFDRFWLVGLAALMAVNAQAAAPAQPPRWMQADDVLVRAGPGPQHKAVGVLQRGAELILRDVKEHGGYCLIEGEGQYGYVACRYLSREQVARAHAGEGGVDVATRWVSGSAVNMREAPLADAPVLVRLALNTQVRLLHDEVEGGYCEVQPPSGPRGFTACRYLSASPLVLSRVSQSMLVGDKPNPDYDPERAFWIAPSWSALERYAEFLKARNPGIEPQGPWPRDEALERMKSHLAKGLNGPAPQAFVDWLELKRKAGQDAGPPAGDELARLQAQGQPLSPEQASRLERDKNTAFELQGALHIWDSLHDAVSAPSGAARMIGLVRALEFPAVQPSLFRSEADIAPPNADAEALSGRFGIVHRYVFSPRPGPGATSPDEQSRAGLYDMLARTTLLVRPVQRVQLLRDGQLRSEPSLARQTQTLWRDVDEPMCSDWSPGFSFGDADGTIWRYFEDGASVGETGRASRQESLKRKPAGSLFAFYTAAALPRNQAIRTQASMKMDRDATGFVRGIQMHFDLDADGVPDLAAWEGEGKGPGHLEGPTATDDRWYRLVLANIAGRWKVLGSDAFSYGCGC